MQACDIVRTGYRRIVQFIRMAEVRLPYCTWDQPLNHSNYKAFISYDGTVHLVLSDSNLNLI